MKTLHEARQRLIARFHRTWARRQDLAYAVLRHNRRDLAPRLARTNRRAMELLGLFDALTAEETAREGQHAK